MTVEAFAALVEGRAVGRNRFQARCPAHDDRSPNLSVAEGRDGRILLHCHAACTTDAILSALKLSQRDLFQGPPPPREQLAALEERRKEMEGRKRAEHAANREAWDKVRRWEAVVNALGAKLARTPDDEAGELIRVFHDACRHLGQAETAALAVSRIGRRHERYVAG